MVLILLLLLAAPPAWEQTANLPAPNGNHDLSGDTIGNKFYMAGGQNATHVFDEIVEFDGVAKTWRVVGKLTHPRFYNGTAALDGKLWIIGGATKAGALSTVEIFDRQSGEVTHGPELPYAIPMALAVHIGNRIYVAGNERLLSIGLGETSWRREPDMPKTGSNQPLAGAALNNRFYITIPKLGLAAFDTGSRTWSVLSAEYPARSAQVAVYRNGIWVMGGRDVPDGAKTRIFDLVTNHWRDGPDLPYPLSWGAAATVNGRLLVVGGAYNSQGSYIYSGSTYLLR